MGILSLEYYSFEVREAYVLQRPENNQKKYWSSGEEVQADNLFEEWTFAGGLISEDNNLG